MEKIISILISFIFLIIFSCEKENESIPYIEAHQDCIQFFLSEYEMAEYTGGSIPCGKTYLVLFEDASTKFAVLHNDCADLQPSILIDCQGNELCVYVTDDACFNMVQNANRIGVIGVDE